MESTFHRFDGRCFFSLFVKVSQSQITPYRSELEMCIRDSIHINRTLKNIPVQNIKFCTGILLYIKNNYLSIVDLGRIALPSKRGNHMLSTCLSLPKIFEHTQDQSHQLMPYPLKFRKSYEEKLKLFPILLCHFIKRFGTCLLYTSIITSIFRSIKGFIFPF